MTKVHLRRRDFLITAGAGAAAALLAQLPHPRFRLPLQNDRYPAPPRLSGAYLRAADGSLQSIGWDAAIARLTTVLQTAAPHQIAFLLGSFPDSLYHLIAQFSGSIGGATLLRYSAQNDMEGGTALRDAARLLLGSSRLPLFDPQEAQVVFSFGSNRAESWVANRQKVENGHRKPAGFWVQFEARRSQTARMADCWTPIRAGSEAQLAQGVWAYGHGNPAGLEAAAFAAGVSIAELQSLATLFWGAKSRLALPGGAALSGMDGLKAAEWILRLNLTDPVNPAFFLAPPPPLHPELAAGTASAAELTALATKMHAGRIKVLIVHGLDPLRLLPKSSELRAALREVETVISLSPYLDTTARIANLLLPDHTPQETWGYHIPMAAADLGRVMLVEPQVQPPDSPSSADVLIQVAHRLGFGNTFSYRAGQEYLLASLAGLSRSAGDISAKNQVTADRRNGEQSVLERPKPVRIHPRATALASCLRPPASFQPGGEDQLRLLIFQSDGDTAENPYAAIQPLTALRLGLRDGAKALISGAGGQIRLPLLYNPDLHPETLAVSYHPGGDPSALELVALQENGAGNFIYSGLPVRIEQAA